MLTQLRTRIGRSLVVVSSIAIVAMQFSGIASAATATNSGQGLELSPPVIELKSDPGQQVTAQIRLRNITKSDLIIKSRIDDFGAKGEDGQPQILLDETQATAYSLKYWVEPIPNLRLAPGNITTLTVKIDVPKTAEPGGHYGVVRFTAQPPELEGTGVALSASIGSLILLKVSGATKESAAVLTQTTNHVVKIGADKSLTLGAVESFFETGPIGFTERIRNDGSVHIRPTGTLDIYNVFGKKVASLPMNDKPGGNILPASTRKFELAWNKKWLFGPYRARTNLVYGANNTALVGKYIVFWVIPWKLILVVLLIIALIVFLARIGLKRYNQHIINQAKKR
jgi:hypothetical protein